MTGSDKRDHGRGESGTDGRGDAVARDERSGEPSPENEPTLGSVGRRTFLGGLAAGAASVATLVSAQTAPSAGPACQMEALDRGLVAVSTDDGMLVRWRLFGTDPEGVGFDVYRDGQRVTEAPITDSTNYLDPAGTTDSIYAVAPVVDGTERERSDSVGVLPENFLEIPLNKPADRTHPDDGSTVSYVANDASVGDLTGDGSIDVVLKWSPENAKDNSQEGTTNEVLFDAYTLEGNHLWRIGLGRNVRAGAHYTPFLVYDFDGDGVAEFVVRTGDGATDGVGTVIGDPDADYRNDSGRILEGAEYLTVFDGTTGEELVTTDYEPVREDICQWGDCYGNRGDRFLAGVAYLDGERPSVVTARGYYEKTALTAWDFRDGELSRRWHFDTDDGWGDYAGQGNHQLSVADVDGDGYDEIIYGAMVVDHDGTGLHTTGWGHGDALHIGNFDPDREGLEIFMPHEETDSPHGASLRDAETGEVIWGEHTGEDTGRGMIADIDPNHRGAEGWASSGVGAHTVDGEELYSAPSSINSAVWWTGDVRRELLAHDVDYDAGDGDPKLEQWDAGNQTLNLVEEFPGTRTNNYTKGNPCLSGDILGDWREEVLYRMPDSEALRLFLTPYETDRRIHTLLHDSQYRVALAECRL